MLEQEIRGITEDGLQEKSGYDCDHLNCMIKTVKDLNGNRKVCTLFDKGKRKTTRNSKENKLYIKFIVWLGTKVKYGVILAIGRMWGKGMNFIMTL